MSSTNSVHSEPNSIYPRFSSPNGSTPPKRVRQDKGESKNGRGASLQAAPLQHVSRAQTVDTNRVRPNKLDTAKVKLVHTTIHLHPLVRAELERIAEREGLSVSKVGAAGLAEWIQGNLHQQHEALLYPVIRQIIREELRAFGNRLVFFLMRIAFAGEQTRILMTNVLDRLLEGKPDVFTKIVDYSNKTARRNILQKTPQIKSLLEEWQQAWKDEGKEAEGSET